MKRRRSPLDRLSRDTRALRRHLPGALEGHDRAVHRSRVASRRLREALPVLAYGAGDARAAKARRRIRQLTRALGTVRELDVALVLLDEFAERPGASTDAIADVRAHLLQERDDRRAVMLERLRAIDGAKLARRLASVLAALSRPAAVEPDGWRPRLAVRIAARAKRLQWRLDEAGPMYAPEALHNVRIAAKKLRYALELADEGGAANAASEIRVLKRAQRTLGRLHDLQVLQHHVGDVAARPRPRAAVPDIALERLARSIEEECRRLHGRYVAQVPRLHATVETIRGPLVSSIGTPARARAARMSLPPLRHAAGDRR